MTGILAEKKREWKGFLFLIPSFAGVGIFWVIPFADVIRRSFFSAVSGEFTGLRNYGTIFENQAFRLAAGNTLRFFAVCIPALVLLSLLIAVLLTRRKKGMQLLKSMFLLPMAIPVASVVILWRVLFDRQGLLNHLFSLLSLSGIDWMNTDASFGVLVISYLWRNLGYDVVLWVAALGAVPESLYDAAKVDGAGEWKCFFHITLPNVLPALFTIVVLSLLNPGGISGGRRLPPGQHVSAAASLQQLVQGSVAGQNGSGGGGDRDGHPSFDSGAAENVGTGWMRGRSQRKGGKDEKGYDGNLDSSGRRGSISRTVSCLRIHDGRNGALSASRSCAGGSRRLCFLEAAAGISDSAFLCEAAPGFTGIFRDVLEFRKDYSFCPGRTDPCGSPGSLGICEIPFSGEEDFVYFVYCTDDDALSGDDAEQLSCAEQPGTSGYAGRNYSPGSVFHFSGLFNVSFFSGDSGGCSGIGKTGRGRRFSDFCADRDTSGVARYDFRPGAGIPGELESSGAAHGVFKDKREMAAVPVSAEYQHGAGGGCFRGVGAGAPSFCAGVPGRAGLSGAGNRLHGG